MGNKAEDSGEGGGGEVGGGGGGFRKSKVKWGKSEKEKSAFPFKHFQSLLADLFHT